MGFLVALADRLTDDYGIEPGNVFATGLSAGAFMATRLACQRADVVAAIAPVAGSLGSAFPAPRRAPVSVFATHGVADQVVPYAGGPMVGRGGPSDIVAPPAMVSAVARSGSTAQPLRSRTSPSAGVHRFTVRGLRRWHRSRVRERRRRRPRVVRRRIGRERTVLRRPTPVSAIAVASNCNDGDAMSAGLFGLLDDVAAIARTGGRLGR